MEHPDDFVIMASQFRSNLETLRDAIDEAALQQTRKDKIEHELVAAYVEVDLAHDALETAYDYLKLLPVIDKEMQESNKNALKRLVQLLFKVFSKAYFVDEISGGELTFGEDPGLWQEFEKAIKAGLHGACSDLTKVRTDLRELMPLPAKRTNGRPWSSDKDRAKAYDLVDLVMHVDTTVELLLAFKSALNTSDDLIEGDETVEVTS